MIFKHYGKSTPQKFWIEKEEKYLVSSTLLQSDALTRYVPLQLTLSGAKKVCSSCQKSLSQTTILFSGQTTFPSSILCTFLFRYFFPSRKQFCLGSDTTSQSVENHEKTRILYVPYFGAKIQTFEDFCSNFPFQEFSIFLPTV